jgi:hypothetical protein
MYKTKILGVLIASVFVFGDTSIYAQEEPRGIENLRTYDFEWLHFGFALGVNTTNFIITPVKDFYKLDSIMVVESDPAVGFNLGIIGEISLHKYVKLRFVPDLSFAQRRLEYQYGGINPSKWIKKVESTFLDFPLDIKLKSKRVTNFGMYILGGGKYIIDLASQKEVDNSGLLPAEQVIKLRKNDIAYSVGAGFDFYLPYFKFSVDLKLSVGIKNLLIKDGTIFSTPIDKLNSKVVLISFNFEG